MSMMDASSVSVIMSKLIQTLPTTYIFHENNEIELKWTKKQINKIGIEITTKKKTEPIQNGVECNT